MRRILLLGAVCAFLLVPLGSAQDPGVPAPGPDPAQRRAPEIVRQMIAAAGGMERWNAVRDASFVLRDTAFGVTAGKPLVTAIQTSFSKDPRPMLRIDVHYAKNIHTKVFDGLEAWLAIDGLLVHKGESTYRRIRDASRTTMLWIAYPFNLVDPGTEVEYLGTDRVVGQEVDLLQVRFGEASQNVVADDVYRYAVNRLTHLTVREDYFVRGEAENRVETLYGDYRNVNGLVKDHLREIVSSTDGRVLQRIEIDGLRFGDFLPPDHFRKPPDPMALDIPRE